MPQELQPIRIGQQVRIKDVKNNDVEWGKIDDFSHTFVEINIDHLITKKLLRYDFVSKSWKNKNGRHYQITVID